ncbi:DUF2964 family protein [Solimonas variicoloris]|uniref:DUF2964 family protein n=1 Tax=Solimonas variicoloris TaxID=254408 RepID=UPI00036210EA|nr:DUF2964 family protein [Solimonas variicoloris]
METLVQYGGFFLALAFVVVGLFAAVRGVLVKRRKAVLVGLICLLLGIAWFAFESHAEFWAVDGCLDSGGRYNHEAQRCERE